MHVVDGVVGGYLDTDERPETDCWRTGRAPKGHPQSASEGAAHPDIRPMAFPLACLAAAALHTPASPHVRMVTPASPSTREVALHRIARRAMLSGNAHDAQKAHDLAIANWGSSRSYLLQALFQQRFGSEHTARYTFQTGIAAHPHDASLMQAWGLFESKHGQLNRAIRLLKRAVTLDPELSPVLSWRPFRAHAHAAGGAGRPRAARAGSPCMMSSPSQEATAEQAPSATQAPSAMTPATPASLAVLPRPAVRYTVPQSPRGWRGRESFGEDPKLWYDAEGLRNGPPANYWRQALDERLHRNFMAGIDAILDGRDDVDDVTALEFRMSIATPLSNRKLLGRWALLVINGVRVATRSVSSELLYVASPELRIRRAGERRTFKHRYGLFDEHMDDGEELVLELGGVGEAAAFAREDDGRVATSLFLPSSPTLGDVGTLHLGGVTLLNDYMLVARSASGKLQDCWMRIDEETAEAA